MLNEDKLKMLTSAARFEKREKKHLSTAFRCFRSDYIVGRLLRAFFSYTFCFCLCVVIWVLYSSESLLSAVSMETLRFPAGAGGLLYAGGLFVYLLITGLVCNKRYEYARRGMNVYLAKLRRLEQRYDKEARDLERGKRGAAQ